MSSAHAACRRAITIAGLLATTLLGGCRPTRALAAGRSCTPGRLADGTRVLVFSRTKGYRHESIPAGIAAITQLGGRYNFAVDSTEDAAAFSDGNLARYAAVVFLSTTGDVLDSTQQAAFERYVRAGHGYVGVHAAADTEYDWPWYGMLVGAYFVRHPKIQQATVNVVDRAHISTRCLSPTLTRTDEWYDYRSRPPADVTVLATVDESTYTGATMGQPHPISWYHRFDGGRAWYTGMGHTLESYSEPAFLDHLAGGIVWAATR
jgi:type 1 glutamine amidotransferase